MVGNHVSFIGRLTADPSVRMSGDNKVVNFTLARNRTHSKNQEHPVADFIRCFAWNAQAELIEKYFKKGNRMGVSGRLETRNYTDNNGVTHNMVEIRVEDIEFIETKAERDGRSDGNTNSTTTSRVTHPASAETNAANADIEAGTPDDSLPF